MVTTRKKCEKNPYLFCYICGKHTLPKRRVKITE